MTITRADISRATGLSNMTIGRAAQALGRRGEPLDDDTALLLLAADEVSQLGLSWPLGLELVRKFADEIHHIAVDPEVRRGWILFVEEGETRFQIAAVSPNHLANLSTAHPLALTLALHWPVAQAVCRRGELKTRKSEAA